jgi:hypothetical protein
MRQIGLRQNNPKNGTARVGRGDRQLTFMTPDDHPANSQSQSHSVKLRRNERIKYGTGFF